MQFIERLGSDYLKVHIDTSHVNTKEDRIEENIIAAGNYIGHVHIAHSNRHFPGRGHYDFAETISALKTIGYDGALSIECLGLPTPIEALTGAHRFLHEAI